jgi:hypothetical protein
MAFSAHELTLKAPPKAFACPPGVDPVWASWPANLVGNTASVGFWAAMAADVGVTTSGTRAQVAATLKAARDAAVAAASGPPAPPAPAARSGRTGQLFPPSTPWASVVQAVLGDAPVLGEAMQEPAVEATLAKLAPADVSRCAASDRCSVLVQETLLALAPEPGRYPALAHMWGASIMARLPEVERELQASALELEAWCAALPPGQAQAIADKAASQRVLAFNSVVQSAKRRKTKHPTTQLVAALATFRVPGAAAALVHAGINDATAPLLPDLDAAVGAAGFTDTFTANNVAAALRSLQPAASGAAAKPPKAIALAGAATRHHVLAASLQVVLAPAASQARLEDLVQQPNLPTGPASEDDLISGKFLAVACPELPANALVRLALLSSYRAPAYSGGGGALQVAISVAHKLDEALAAHLLVQVCGIFMVGDDLTEQLDPTGFWFLRCGDLKEFLASAGFRALCQLAEVGWPLEFGDHKAMAMLQALSATVERFFGLPVSQGLGRLAAKAARLSAAATAAASVDNSAVFFARWSAALDSQCVELRRGVAGTGVVCALALPESGAETANYAVLLERARSAAQARGAASPGVAGAASPSVSFAASPQRWKAVAGAPANGATYKVVKGINDSLGPKKCVYDLFGVAGCTNVGCPKCK